MSTDDTSVGSQFQLVPAYGSSSDNKSDADSSRTVSYEVLIGKPDLFWDNLRNFLGGLGRTLKIPTVGGEIMDLYRLFVEVTTRGGLEKVIKDRKCKEVIGTFKFEKSMTNAAYVLRRNYKKALFEFEHVFFFRQPLSSFCEREEAVKQLVAKAAHNKGTQKLRRGCKIEGILDGKFDNGYFVTMKVGSQDLKGVIYHTPPASLETTRRRKKKAKLSHLDAYRPKFHRSAYNFFFSDYYRMLKPKFVGQERLLIKEIGKRWSNSSPSDRKVYQDKGVKDMERYTVEMTAYKFLVESCAAEIAAATDGTAANVTEAEPELEPEPEPEPETETQTETEPGL